MTFLLLVRGMIYICATGDSTELRPLNWVHTFMLSSHETPAARCWCIRTSNRKVIGSTPDRSTRNFFFPVCLRQYLKKLNLYIYLSYNFSCLSSINYPRIKVGK